MAEVFLCSVSAVHYADGTADVAVIERENIIMADVPFLDTVYEMPEVGEVVAVLFEEKNGRLLRGVILGRLCSEKKRPAKSGIFYKEFKDGAYVKYDSSSKTMEVSAEKLCVKRLTAETIVYTDSCKKG